MGASSGHLRVRGSSVASAAHSQVPTRNYLRTFLRRACVHVGGLHVARRLRAFTLALSLPTPMPVPAPATQQRYLPFQAQARRPTRPSLCLAPVPAPSACYFSLRLRLCAQLPRPPFSPGPAPGFDTELLLSAKTKLAGTLALRTPPLSAARRWPAAARTSPTPRAHPSSVRGWDHPRANAWAEGMRGASAHAWTCSCLGSQRIGWATA
jgi:hypothetical protein